MLSMRYDGFLTHRVSPPRSGIFAAISLVSCILVSCDGPTPTKGPAPTAPEAKAEPVAPEASGSSLVKIEPRPESSAAPTSPLARAAQGDGMRAVALVGKSRSLERRGDLKGAEAAIDEALRLVPGNVAASERKSMLARADGRFEDALEALDRSLEVHGDAASSLLLEKARVLYEKKDLAPALETVNEYLASGAHSYTGHIHYLRAKILAASNEKDAAVSSFAEAVKERYMNPVELEADLAAGSFRQIAGDLRFEKIVGELRERARDSASSELLVFSEPGGEGDPIPAEAGNAYPADELFTQMNWNVQNERTPALPAAADLSGETVDWPRFRGKTMVVVVWGPWSESSREQVRITEDVRKRIAGDEYAFVGVSYPVNTEKDVAAVNLQATLDTLGATFPQYVVGKRVVEALGVTAFPSVLFVDRKGRVLLNSKGLHHAEALEKLTRAAGTLDD